MKITLEFDPTSGAVTTSAPAATPEPKQASQPDAKPAGFPLSESAPQPQGETIAKAHTVVDTPTPGPVPTPSAPVKFTEAPPASSLSTGTLYGGQPNTSDPDKDNPNVFRFEQPPREE